MDSSRARLNWGKFSGFLLGLFLFATISQANEESEKVSFIQKLRAQEEQEYLALENDIITMSDSDYKVMLAKRMKGAFLEPGSTQKLAVVVDVSEQMNQPIAGFFRKLLGTDKEAKMMGVDAVQSILSDKGLNGSEITLKRQESSDEGSLHYQKVEGMFTQKACELLLSSPKVTDVFVVKASDTPTLMETFYIPKGRIIPPPVYKQYDDNLIDEGLYQDIMTRLDKTDLVIISIGFHEEPGYYDSFTQEKENARLKLVDEFLESLGDLNIEVHDKRPFAIYATVDRAAAKIIYEDPRINYIRLAKEGEEFIR